MGNRNSCLPCGAPANEITCFPFARNQNPTESVCSNCEKLKKEIGYMRTHLANKRIHENHIKSKFFDIYIDLKRQLQKEDKKDKTRRKSV